MRYRRARTREEFRTISDYLLRRRKRVTPETESRVFPARRVSKDPILEDAFSSSMTPCHYCARPTFGRPDYQAPDFHRDRRRTIDHKVPRAHGGTHAQHNILVSCGRCNEAKGDTPYDLFIAFVKEAVVKNPNGSSREYRMMFWAWLRGRFSPE